MRKRSKFGKIVLLIVQKLTFLSRKSAWSPPLPENFVGIGIGIDLGIGIGKKLEFDTDTDTKRSRPIPIPDTSPSGPRPIPILVSVSLPSLIAYLGWIWFGNKWS